MGSRRRRSLCGGGSRAGADWRARPRAGGRPWPAGRPGPHSTRSPRLLASSDSFSPPPRRRRPATRSPWALRSSEVLRQPRGRGVPTSPWAPCAFPPFSSLPLSWQAPAEAVDPPRPQQIRARRRARPGRPPPPTGRRGRGGGASGRVAARKGLARGRRGRGAGAAPVSRRERADAPRGPPGSPTLSVPVPAPGPPPGATLEGPRV